MRGPAAPGEIGLHHAFRLMYDEAQKAGIPPRHYEKFVNSINDLLTGFQDEKKWKVADTPPPLPIYNAVRSITAGAIPYCKYAPVQRDYRDLPDFVLEHPHILRMHWLTGLLVAYHNDFISAFRELSRKGDVVNIVAVIAHERDLSLEDAWMDAMELHDQALHEFILLQENLPDFGEWQAKAKIYAADLGTNVQGIYTWHHRDALRYRPAPTSNPPL
ncbi:terpene synthase family protein [Amycolatopsis sulphurea]|uniref:terpene synthase family protein n=1 Tax=Amycolatopsis sulphurea TaxID=76022 RepID=UPI000BFA53E5|nr:terpene synthase family protein [Amycolatopsis sulphurea]